MTPSGSGSHPFEDVHEDLDLSPAAGQVGPRGECLQPLEKAPAHIDPHGHLVLPALVCFELCEKLRGEGHTWDLVVQIEGLLEAGHGEEPGEYLEGQAGGAVEEPLRGLEGEDGLAHGEGCTGVQARLELIQFLVEVAGGQVHPNPHGEVGPGADGVVGEVVAPVEGGDDLHEAHNVHVVDGGGRGEIADGRGISRQGKDAVHPQESRSQELGLEGQEVPVPASHVKDRGEPRLLLDEVGQSHGRDPNAGHGVVRDVHGGCPGLLEAPCRFHGLPRVGSLGRVDLAGDGEPLVQFLEEPHGDGMGRREGLGGHLLDDHVALGAHLALHGRPALHHGGDGAYGLGGRPAASAHDVDPQVHVALDVARHVLGAGEVVELAVHLRGVARVGHDHEGVVHVAGHLLHEGQGVGGAHGAVDAHHVRTVGGQALAPLHGRVAEEGAAVLVEGEGGEDGEVGGHLPAGLDEEPRFEGGLLGLDDEEVGARLGQCGDLLETDLPGLGFVHVTVGLEHDLEGADGGAHPDGASVGRPARDLHAPDVNIPHAVVEIVLGQIEAVGLEGVGGEDPRPRVDVFAMEGEDQVRLGDVGLLEAVAPSGCPASSRRFPWRRPPRSPILSSNSLALRVWSSFVSDGGPSGPELGDWVIR